MLKINIPRYMSIIFSILCLAICGVIRFLYFNSIVNLFEGFAGITAVICLTLTSGGFCKIFEKYSNYSMALYLLNGYWLVISRTAICRILSVNNALIIIIFNVLIDFYLSFLFIRYVFSRFKMARLFLGIK